MLSRLIKYEMKAMGRILAPIYVLVLAASLMLSVVSTSAGSNSVLLTAFLDKFEMVLVLLFLVAVLIMSVMMVVVVIQRFYRNLLGQEGYLMFTLPVTTAQHLIGKSVTALIWIFLGGAVGGLAGVLLMWDYALEGSFWKEMGKAFHELFAYFGNGNAGIGGSLLLILTVLTILRMLMHVYASLTVGHLWNNHRMLGSVLFYIGTGLISLVIRQLMERVQHVHAAVSKVDSLVISYATTGSAVIGKGAMLTYIITAALYLIVYSIITWYVLDKKLNLE